ncbi:MAG: DNA adenine methylase [Bacteroidales bacterium]|nr:DNA adenine methylase [Bacteroidales bacterium]
MRFIGNKENLVEWIFSEIQKNDIKGKHFFDFFAGTSNVGRYFKTKDYVVVSSDLLYFSYVLQKAYIENNEQPKFKTLLKNINVQSKTLFARELDLVFEYLNNLKGIEGFIYKNYTPEGTKKLELPRMYFINENGKKIDAIRQQIENWKNDNLITENEYFILLAGLIESVPFYSNILGVYAAFKKDWDPRAIKAFELKPINLINGDKKHYSYNQNSMELLDKYEFDIIYLDPPYNQRQYAPNYHLLETIAKYDNPEINGVSGMRNYQNQKSDFCNAEKALTELEKILLSKNYKHLLLSYNNEGIMPQDKITKLMKNYGDLNLVEYDYLRFKCNNNGQAKNKKFIKEQLYILKRK